MLIKTELTRAAIDHILLWATGYRNKFRWTKHDTNLTNVLHLIKKQVGRRAYNKQKIKELIGDDVSKEKLQEIIKIVDEAPITLRLKK